MKLIPIYLILLAALFVLACRKSPGSAYIISKEDSIAKVKATTTAGTILLPPTVNQGLHNFVVDSNNNFYYYSPFQFKPADGRIYDDDVFGDEAYFMNLSPNHLFAIPHGLEKEFFEANVLKLISSRPYKPVYVGSVKDTVDHEFIRYLLSVADTSKHISVRIRLVLHEEKEVLRSKLAGTYYDPAKIKWDSTKTIFE
jgi:hypothetical protein